MEFNWLNVGRNLLIDGRRRDSISIISPCCGLETAVVALKGLGMEVVSYAWDTDKSLHDQITHEHGGKGATHIGRKAGDFSQVSFEGLPDVDGLIAGPPCPPFSRSGTGSGWDDKRSRPFIAVLVAIRELSARPGKFMFFCIENVACLADKKGGGESPAAEVQRWLVDALPSGWIVWS